MLRPALPRFASLRRLLLLWAMACLALPAAAQVQRNFPQDALRGALVFGESPEVALNGRPARLAPGARVRDGNNLSVVPGPLLGGRFAVHYTVDTLGLLREVWILRPDEAAVRWPTNVQEAQRWAFDPAANAWYRP